MNFEEGYPKVPYHKSAHGRTVLLCALSVLHPPVVPITPLFSLCSPSACLLPRVCIPASALSVCVFLCSGLWSVMFNNWTLNWFGLLFKIKWYKTAEFCLVCARRVKTNAQLGFFRTFVKTEHEHEHGHGQGRPSNRKSNQEIIGHSQANIFLSMRDGAETITKDALVQMHKGWQ